MPRDKKHAKGRLDKYYHMAKEQGYRARSAFKLIQLNKKYNFLEKSKCVVDLCAAPGGWLQVAAKYMPRPNLIIGIDLAPIKPIPGVITFTADITTDKCKAMLKTELKHWKVDTVLHDGAPNVGVSWLQDAFTQSELTLSALKLATQFLMPGGTFVTKVFRSKDYNKLLWVFNQLFKKVEATKPASSRNVSAEIFVVCREYVAPEYIDPKFLDSRYVFQELDETEATNDDPKIKKEKENVMLNDLFHPEKRRRHRDGYADGDYTLHKTINAMEFIQSKEYISILASGSQLVFPKDEEHDQLKNHVLTSEEILHCCDDLKLLGKREFKNLLRWREQIRSVLGLSQPKQVQEEKKEEQVEETLEEMMEREAKTLNAKLKKEKRKTRERKAKQLIKMNLGMKTPADIGLEASAIGLEEGDDFGNTTLSMPSLPADFDSTDEESKSSEGTVSSEEEDLNSDEETANRVSQLEGEMDQLFEFYDARRAERDPTAKIKADKKKKKLEEGPAAQFEEWYGLEYDQKKRKFDQVSEASDSDSDSDSGSDSDNQSEDGNLSRRAQTFFDNPIFKESDIPKPVTSAFDEEMTDLSSDEEIQPVRKPMKDSDDFEVVPATKEKGSDDETDDDFIINTAASYTLAQKMLRKSGKRDAIDDGFNRYTYHDPDTLPSWFLQDENRHNRPQRPATKEAVQVMRERMKALDARPIKKVAEAKFRKKMRTMKRIEKMQKKAAVIVDGSDDEKPDAHKLKDVAKMMSKAAAKKQDKKPQLVVAKGFRKGVQGRPKGVKGRYKMVDPRMKKELRATKRQQKAQKKRR